MLPISRWSNSSLIYPCPLQEDRVLITCPVTEVLNRVSGLVTGPIVPSDMEVRPSFVGVPKQEMQTFYHAGVPACRDMHRLTLTLRSSVAFWTTGWSDVVLFNTYLVPKHETKWTYLVGTWAVLTWRTLLISRLFPVRQKKWRSFMKLIQTLTDNL